MYKYASYLAIILLLPAVNNMVYAATNSCTCNNGVVVPTTFTGRCAKGAALRTICSFSCGTVGLRSASCSIDCLGESTLLYSCSDDEYVEAGSVTVGDSIRTMTLEGPRCSDVFYKYQHAGKFNALSFDIEGSKSPLVFSDNHLVYVGEEFGKHNPTYAKNIKIGDKLVSKDGSPKKVLFIKKTISGLVNVLTLNPNLELESGVIVSAYSYNESLYAIPFVPLKMMYKIFGAQYMRNILENTSTEAQLAKFDYYMGYALDLFSL